MSKEISKEISKQIQPPHKSRIAIAGATGRVGATLTSLLASDPVDITVLTRRPDAVQRPKDASKGVSIAAVDFDRPHTLQNALRGADRLFVSHGTSSQQVANEIALIDAAVAAGVRHIVKLSALGPASRLNPLAWHMQIEAHLAQQAVASTVLRPSAFVDILTMRQVAEHLSTLLGQPVAYVNRSPEEQRAALSADGLAPMVADLLVGLDQMFRESVLAETTSTVEALTGKPPRTLQQWLVENVGIFRS